MSDNFDETEVFEHLSSCKSCKNWIDSELNTPPDGMTPEKWNNIKINMSEYNSKLNNAKPVHNEKSFWDYYLSGLKYGIVFGLAIVIGFSIIKSQNTNDDNINIVDKTKENSISIPLESSISSQTNRLIKDIPNER